MSTYSLKQFSRPEVLMSIDRRCLVQMLWPHRAFFTQRGIALPDPSKNTLPQLDLQALCKVLVTPDIDTPNSLADALYYTHEMSTPSGMDGLIGVIGLERLGCGILELSPADIAVRAWVVDRDALERTHAEMFASRPRYFHYFQSDQSFVPMFDPPDDDKLKPLEAYLDGAFHQYNRGRGTRVFSYAHEKDCLFLVRHGDPYRREGTMQGVEPGSVLYRPLRFDIVIYDIATATLRVHAQTKWETSMYRGGFGMHLFGSMDYFPNEGRYTLEPLLSKGEASLECVDIPELKYVVLTEARFSWGGPFKEIETRRAKNLFAALERRRIGFPTAPKLIRAAFDIHFRGCRKGRPLVIEPPNIARYTRDEDCWVVDQWLSRRGFLRRPLPDVDGQAPKSVLAGR
jgi:hypothetical protein